MQIRVFSNVLVAGVWHEPGIGNYSPEMAKHLIDLGVAEAYETKVSTVTEKKTLPITSASLPAQASQKKTARPSKGKGKLSR